MRRYSVRKSKEAHERAVRRGKLGAAANAAKRIKNSSQIERPRIPVGEHLGVLQWSGSDGAVHRYHVIQAERRNQIVVTFKGKRLGPFGFDHLLKCLRKHLVPLQRG
jgi:hypothetical protein